jgi:hypothetical protein
LRSSPAQFGSSLEYSLPSVWRWVRQTWVLVLGEEEGDLLQAEEIRQKELVQW